MNCVTTSRYTDLVAFVVLVLVKGFSAPALEIGLRFAPVLLLSALRFDVAGIVLFGYVIATGTPWKPRTSGDYVTLFAGGILTFTVATALWGIGQDLTTAALSGLMASLVPVLTVGFSWLLLPRDRLSSVGLLGLAVGFGGALLILLPGGPLQFDSGLTGKAMIFFGVAISSLAGVMIRWAEPALPPASQTAWSMAIGAVFLHAMSFILEPPLASVPVTTLGVGVVLFLGVITSAIGRGLFYWLLGHRSAIEISLTSYASPVIAGVTGWYLFRDRITIWMVIGFVLVLFGFLVIKREAVRNEFVRLEIGA